MMASNQKRKFVKRDGHFYGSALILCFLVFSANFFLIGTAQANVATIGASATYYEYGASTCNPSVFSPVIDQGGGQAEYEGEMTFDLSSISGSVNSAKICAYRYTSSGGGTPINYIEKISSSVCDNAPSISSPPPDIGSAVIPFTGAWHCINITPAEVSIGSNFYTRWWGQDLNGLTAPRAYFRGPAAALSNCGGANPSGAPDCRPYIEVDYTGAA